VSAILDLAIFFCTPSIENERKRIKHARIAHIEQQITKKRGPEALIPKKKGNLLFRSQSDVPAPSPVRNKFGNKTEGDSLKEKMLI